MRGLDHFGDYALKEEEGTVYRPPKEQKAETVEAVTD